MARRSTLNVPTERQLSVLRRLAVMQFATQAQLAYWLELGHTALSRPINKLIDMGLIEPNDNLRPFVYRLSQSGSAYMGQNYVSRWKSASAIQQAVLANEIEILLQGEFAFCRRMPRKQLWALGLYPSHGEHGFAISDTDILFVLIDDYLMESPRIKHCWKREHLNTTKSKNFRAEHDKAFQQGDYRFKTWASVASQYYVYCVDPRNLARHKRFVEKESLPVKLFPIKALWGVS